MERHDFKKVCKEMGVCCVNGCLVVEDLKAQHKPASRLTGGWFERFGFTYFAGARILRKWRNGYYKCENKPECILVRTGVKKEDTPTMGPEHRAFIALRNATLEVRRVKTTIEPIGKPLMARIIGMSKSDWLHLSISMQEIDMEIKLGDQLQLTSSLWGTVVAIDGPVVTLVLPGDKHGQRNKYITPTN